MTRRKAPPAPSTDRAEIDTLLRQRTVHTRAALAPHRSVAEDLVTILETPGIGRTVALLISELAWLCTMADARKGGGMDERVGGSRTPPVPSFRPVWAERRLDQVEACLWQEAQSIASWVHRPHDPGRRERECSVCGGRLGREDLHCRRCGEPTLRKFRREEKAG